MKRILTGTVIVALALAMVPATASASIPHSPAAVRTSSCPVFDLNGVYDAGAGPAQPIITDVNGSLTVNMFLFNRPNGTGTVLNCNTIQVFFPDDNWYTATLEAPATIRWSNGTVWYRLRLVPQVLGQYESPATLTLVNAGFVKGTVARPLSCNASIINRVRNQFPTALSLAVAGSPVNLTIPKQAPNCP